jgi:pilus assembly protein CpaB
MRQRDDVTPIFAILSSALVSVGLTAAFLARGTEPTPVKAAETVPVVVAARDLEVGTLLTAADVKVVEWPGSAAPVEFASSRDQVVGLSLLAPVVMNEPIRMQSLLWQETGAAPIPDGLRAVSFRLHDQAALAGWVRPGSRIDILVSERRLGAEQRPTRVVLENAVVVGNDRSVAQEPNGEAVATAIVTVLVTPEDAEVLGNASIGGEFHVVLRNTP